MRSRIGHCVGIRNSILTETLNWATMLADDPDGHRYLYAWASCKARGDVFADVVRESGWKRRTVDEGRRRAADTIAHNVAEALTRRLDSRQTGTARLPQQAKLERVG